MYYLLIHLKCYTMIVTRIEELDKSKCKVYIDEEYAFLLYQKDIKSYGLTEGEILSLLDYEKIIEDTVFRRAKQKALAILKFSDRSEKELHKKLSEADYTEEIIERTLAYVKEYGYLNDERYAAAFVRSRMNTKSKLVIKNELMQKGLSKDIIDLVILNEYGDEEQEDIEMVAIKKAIAKKSKAPELLNYDEKQKLIASLYRKGFDLSKIKQILP